MTDRELLEAAAKAAGYKIHHWCTILPGPVLVDPATGDCGGFWNPLTEDGDALQLAVKLGITVSINHAKGNFPARTIVWAFQVPKVHETHGDDPCAATRRAIVRAAAAHPGPREGVDTL